MMESDSSLDQPLIEQSEASTLLPPHIFPGFMGVKIAPGIEKIYSPVEQMQRTPALF
jgi:hypothetical protein